MANTNSAWKILNSYFDKIIILTINRNQDRIIRLNKVLEGLDFELFLGVDGQFLVIDELLKKNEISKNINGIFVDTSLTYMNMHVEKIHNNEIACALSHKNIYKYIVDNNLSKVLIFEDDVIPTITNFKYLISTLNELPKKWDIFYLGHMINNDFSLISKFRNHYLVNILYALGFRSKSVLRKKYNYPVDFSKMLKMNGGHTGLHAYAVTKEGAEKLLLAQTPLTYVADLLIMHLIAQRKISSYTSRHIFFEQNKQIQSSIWGK